MSSTLLPFVGVYVIAEETFLGAGLVPGVGAFGFEGVEDAGVDGLVPQKEIVVGGEGSFLDESM